MTAVTDKSQPEIAIVLPCYNEALTIVPVIRQMRAALPNARIIVFDNNSKDGSGDLARKEGVEVREV
ncbi:MAG: glycosyl transferase, partial [Alphaproteobacteria bacterium]|nr:glycosyl transferase [Alphaproteobacteria bacterium]